MLGVQPKVPVLEISSAIAVTGTTLVEGSCNSTRDMAIDVVGFQVVTNFLPAVTMSPSPDLDTGVSKGSQLEW